MNFDKWAALGAQGVAGGTIVAWLAFVFVTRPVSTGGIDGVLHLALAAASFVPFAMISVTHAWFAQQLKVGRSVIRG
ncbi:MAG: hypothetical protein ACKOH8_03250 [Gemmatimonadota bacterium]